ncbi:MULTISPECIES: cytochrome P450 [Actinomadura]|uniref:Cytochrome P450 n=1 Tax=Actinomadura citrea TaxID=46158 RepID=A0A7Y9GDR1_9ACTN|nr:cytochrome P450 [Actinomadura citrea]NYE14564.1 cytochrome P450 [Actinomadura citrea]GGU09474.1 cytochrome P450 [Actinomadura citrea]
MPDHEHMPDQEHPHEAEARGAPFPWRRPGPFAPPDRHRECREAPGLTRVPRSAGEPTWVVTRYAEVREALNDERLGNDRGRPGFPAPFPIPKDFTLNSSLLGMDPPRHTDYRKRVAKDFTVRRVKLLRPRVEEIVDGQVAALADAGPPCDLLAGFALPITISVIMELLGIPPRDKDFLHVRTRTMFGGTATAAERKEAVNQLDAYFRDLVAAKYDDPGDDLVSKLTGAFPREDDFDELVHLTRLLFNGGHESTASMIAVGTLALLRHPDQLDLLRGDPDLAPQAVEELLRYLSVTDLTTARVARTDLTISGTPVREGEGVFPLTAAANRDPEAFERPDELDITRGSRKHLAFGHGRHLCLGSELARLELEVVFRTLYRRLPGLRLAVPFEELSFKDGGLVYGVEALPVTW